MIQPIDVAALKRDFAIFDKKMRGGKQLVYLDSGATSQKPRQVLDAERFFYENNNAAVHRGAHLLAEEANEAYEGARQIVADFIGAGADETIFTKSATESLNLIAYSFGNSKPGSKFHLKAGDRIVVSEMEHHANLIPWQQLAKRTGAELVWFEITEEGRLDLSKIADVINNKTKIVAITHQSNVLGTINPIQEITQAAKKVGAVVVLDACQSAPHFRIDVKELGIDFLAFSGHKALGPTGVGICWGKGEHLSEMEPFLTGGSMIETVTMTDATWAPAPRKFEAGVPNMAQAVGLAAALNYLSKIGMDRVAEHDALLTEYALSKLVALPGVSVIGPQNGLDRGAVVSFTIDGIHPHDVGQALDGNGIAVRTGHHCAWPLMRKLNLVGTTRASFYIYNDLQDIDILVQSIGEAQKFFGVL
ncbi:MAG: cysteine desulfurase [Actinobacteria bacterium]|jgi:cysteine desulfurase/selenocysteine lyase|nr:cysteine desulfurase [Actinomycetota bacterium]